MAYYDKPNGRVLLKNGESVLSSFSYARRILNGEPVDGVLVMRDVHSDKFESLNGISISSELVDFDPEPLPHEHTDDELSELIQYIERSERFMGTDDEIDRISLELDYFIRTLNIPFILECKKLIDKFKEDDIIWGVGRGSSCASYICFLLEINDVNPIKYNIPFNELSKEQ